MGESQSRYSIVERLTQRKLDIIKSRSSIDGDVMDAEGQIVAAEASKAAYIAEADAEKMSHVVRHDENIASAKRKHAQLSNNKALREKAYDEQLKAIEQALEQLKEVSRDAAAQSQS